jgi:serine protease Do
MRSFLSPAVLLAALLAAAPAVADNAASSGSLSQVFKRVGPAVVVVRTTERVAARGAPGEVPVSVAGVGSGVLVSADGQVMTAAHVVQTADAVAVEFPGGVQVRARVVAADAPADVALLQLDRVPPGVTPARLGDSDRAEVGDQVFIVGAPMGITHTLTVGHLSARRKPNATFSAMTTAELFQTDAAINQGNSGGPMFNLKGEVIGLVSHIVSMSGGSHGLGFVVTSNMARRLLLEEPSVWSGLDGYLLDAEVGRAFNIPSPGTGLLVQRVASGSPADRLGVRGGYLPVRIGDEQVLLGGDIVMTVDGIEVGTQAAVEKIRKRMVAARADGSTLRFVVLREGQLVELTGAVEDPGRRSAQVAGTGLRLKGRP